MKLSTIILRKGNHSSIYNSILRFSQIHVHEGLLIPHSFNLVIRIFQMFYLINGKIFKERETI